MSIAVVRRAADHAGRTAVVDERGEHAYDELLERSARVAQRLLDGRADLDEERVALMVAPGADYVAVQWGIWRAGGIAVPLCLSHPDPELEYVLDDTGAALLVAGAGFADRLRPLADARRARLLRAGAVEAPADSPAAPGHGSADRAPALPEIGLDRGAMILYTSGTTSRPKGVVTTHANLRAQVETLIDAWGWTPDDRILHVLPLHHTHGIVNVLLCALHAGAVCDMLPGFDAGRVWAKVLDGRLTLFMAVPTIYYRLIAAWEDAPAERRERMSDACRELRLMVSGSAALPVSTFETWRRISGHALLERYGMTEIGMALSNPLEGERRPGTVGQPLPGVELRLVDDSGGQITDAGEPGQIQVRGPGVFLEYWNRPAATREAFTTDGWFRTGDVAVLEDGYYRILGRQSVDIIKTGGYKVSALEIEEVLRAHPGVADCAVVGVEDPEWGERVCAAVAAAAPSSSASSPAPAAPSSSASAPAPAAEELREWTAERLAPYKIPRRWILVDELPRNVMGKVTKPAVKELFA